MFRRRRYLGLPHRGRPAARNLVSITKFEASVERRPVSINENADTVQIFHPPFKASCTLRVKACKHQGLDFSVGFVQLVSFRKCQLQYNIGTAHWEFFGLASGEMIVDSDGEQLPFYGSKKEVKNISGKQEAEQHISISMVDQPSIKCSWSLDLWACSTSRDSGASKLSPLLKAIRRDQRFLTCVLLLDHVTGDMKILDTVEWGLKLTSLVDLGQKIGRRVRVSRGEQCQPRGITANRKRKLVKSLNDDKCTAVTANDADMLIWNHERCLNTVTIVHSRTCYDNLQLSKSFSQDMKDKKVSEALHKTLLKLF